jgi:hypothetical protein
METVQAVSDFQCSTLFWHYARYNRNLTERISGVLLQFRFYCLLPFFAVRIVIVLKLSMYRFESGWSTSLILINKKHHSVEHFQQAFC